MFETNVNGTPAEVNVNVLYTLGGDRARMNYLTGSLEMSPSQAVATLKRLGYIPCEYAN